jgi:hypothetical protein
MFIVRCGIKGYESESLDVFIEFHLKIKVNLAKLYLVIDIKLVIFELKF